MYVDGVRKAVEMWIGRMGVRFSEGWERMVFSTQMTWHYMVSRKKVSDERRR